MKQNLVRPLLGSVLACLLLSGCQVTRWNEGPQIYTIHPAPPFLTEALALEKARETLARDGFSLDEWPIMKTDAPKGKTPDGPRDKYFDRFSFRPHAGRVHFSNGKKTRSYDVSLDGDRLTCTRFRGL